MIVTRTPLRISFCGGGSDLPSFYKKHEGHVVSTAVNKYIYLTLERSFHLDTISLKYSTVERVKSFDEIKHPIFRECLRMHDVQGVEINSTADIPGGTGMGSSSSFAVGVINLLRAYQGKESDKELLAKTACEIEMDILKEPIGKQDQYAAAFGGLNYYRFKRDGGVDIEPLTLSEDSKDSLEKRLALFYIGGERNSGDILKEQIKSSDKRDVDQKRMCSLAIKLKNDLLSNNIDSLGKLLNEGWKLKRGLADGISNDKIDDIYELGVANGAVGGKLLGAGGAGFMLFYVYEEDRPGLMSAMTMCREIPFSLEDMGSQIVFNDQR